MGQLRLVVAVPLALVLLAGACDTTPERDDLLERLNAIPGLHAREDSGNWEWIPEAYYGYVQHFHLEYDQPVDHARPDGARYTQYATLRMTTANRHRPMVVHVSGGAIGGAPDYTELTRMLAANELTVEHRYFGASVPEPVDHGFLTLEQAAGDLHRLREALRPLFPGTWVSVGASTGGEVALAYRRFYPDDVAATLAYVAPSLASARDPRVSAFVEDVDGAACRDRLIEFQRTALAAMPELLAFIEAQIEGPGDTFERVGLERALEHTILAFPLEFWQERVQADCDELPGAGASAAELLAAMDGFVGYGGVYCRSDSFLRFFEPWFYRAGTELGWPDYPEAHLADLLRFPGSARADLPALALDTPVVYDPRPAQDLRDWVASSGERIMLVYGEHDPWSAAMFEVDGALDSARFIQPGGNHHANLYGLAGPDRARAMALLSRWLRWRVQDPHRPWWSGRPYVSDFPLLR